MKVKMFVKDSGYGDLIGEWWYNTDAGVQYGSDVPITFIKEGKWWDKYEYTHGGNIYCAVCDAIYDYDKPIKEGDTIELELEV